MFSAVVFAWVWVFAKKGGIFGQQRSHSLEMKFAQWCRLTPSFRRPNLQAGWRGQSFLGGGGEKQDNSSDMLEGGKVESCLQLTGSDLGQSRIVIEAGCCQDEGSRKREAVIESGRRQGSDSLQEIACADAESACEQAGGECAEAPPAAGSSGSDGFSEASSDGEAEAENGGESPTVIVSITGESFMQVAMPSLSACCLELPIFTITFEPRPLS
jgi:hypothetical protein